MAASPQHLRRKQLRDSGTPQRELPSYGTLEEAALAETLELLDDYGGDGGGGGSSHFGGGGLGQKQNSSSELPSLRSGLGYGSNSYGGGGGAAAAGGRLSWGEMEGMMESGQVMFGRPGDILGSMSARSNRKERKPSAESSQRALPLEQRALTPSSAVPPL